MKTDTMPRMDIVAEMLNSMGACLRRDATEYEVILAVCKLVANLAHLLPYEDSIDTVLDLISDIYDDIENDLRHNDQNTGNQ